MTYLEMVASAPAGRGLFTIEDVARLERATLTLMTRSDAGAVPLEELATAVGGGRLLDRIAARLPGERAARLAAIARRAAASPAREAAASRVVAALFWHLVYELAPERWDELAQVERIHPELLRSLPCDRATVVEVAAGSGRLTMELVRRCRALLALEPAPTLRRLLAARLREARSAGCDVQVAGAFADALPARSGAADMVVACAALGPEAPLGGAAVLAEMERCARPGGAVVVVAPERPAWFEEQGYRLVDFGIPDTPAVPPHIEQFFGPVSPIHDLAIKDL